MLDADCPLPSLCDWGGRGQKTFVHLFKASMLDVRRVGCYYVDATFRGHNILCDKPLVDTECILAKQHETIDTTRGRQMA